MVGFGGVSGVSGALAGVVSAGVVRGGVERRGMGGWIYTPAPGKMGALQARFRDHTRKLFEKHGMKNVGYWVTVDPVVVEGKAEEAKLVYLLGHKSREGAKESWKGFVADPAWTAARTESEREGPLVAKVESVYLAPTDFSAMK